MKKRERKLSGEKMKKETNEEEKEKTYKIWGKNDKVINF